MVPAPRSYFKLGFWRQASSIQQMPVLTGSRCPGGGLDSEFILTVNIHCLCPVPVPVCLLLFSSVPGSTGVCGCWIQVQRGVQQPEPRRPFWVSVPAPPHQYGGSGAGYWSGCVRTQAFPKSEPGLALPYVLRLSGLLYSSRLFVSRFNRFPCGLCAKNFLCVSAEPRVVSARRTFRVRGIPPRSLFLLLCRSLLLSPRTC